MTRISAWFKAQSSSSNVRLGLIGLVILGMSAAACTAGSDNGDSSANDFSTDDGYSRLPYVAQGSAPNHGNAPGQVFLLK
jgi:hypothetical protein